MATKERLLAHLLSAPNQWFSGQSLADQLGVSRESVWKAIRSLQQAGYQIDSDRKRGYCYRGTAKMLAPVIEQGLGTTKVKLVVEEELESTQTTARQLLATGDSTAPLVVIADHQIGAYGRRGRAFYAPKATGLYMTIGVPNVTFPGQPGLLTTGVAVTVATVLKRFFPAQRLSYKWVNDLYLGHQKVVGILTEMQTDLEATSQTSLVIGIGINLTTKEFPADLKEKVTGIDPAATVDRNRLAAELIEAVLSDLPDYSQGIFLPEYRAHSLILGRSVSLQIGQTTFSGIAQNIDDQGQLVVRAPNGQLRTFSSGEVTKVNF